MRIAVSVFCFLFAIGLKAALAASGTGAAPNPVPNPKNPTENVPLPRNAAGADVPTDSQIVQILLNANDADVDASKLAQQKASNDEVKQYAKNAEKQHKDQNKKIDELMDKQQILKEESQTARGMKSVGKDTERELKRLGGIDFDRAYIASEVSMNQMILGSLDQDLIPNAESREVKQYLKTLRPQIADNLNKAKQLEEKISSNAGATSGKE